MLRPKVWIERMLGTPGVSTFRVCISYLGLHAPMGQWRVAWGKAKRRPRSASNVFSKQPRQGLRRYDALNAHESAFPFDFCH
jgi:hypothetical protein